MGAHHLSHAPEMPARPALETFTLALSRTRAKEMALDTRATLNPRQQRLAELVERRQAGEKLSYNELDELARLRRSAQRTRETLDPLHKQRVQQRDELERRNRQRGFDGPTRTR